MMEAAYVRATCRSIADQPHRGWRGLVKEQKEASHPKRSMALRLPNSSRASRREASRSGSSAAWGGRRMTATAWKVAWIQAIDARTDQIETHCPFRASGEQMGHHGRWRGRAERRGANRSRGRAGYARDSRVRGSADAEQAHGFHCWEVRGMRGCPTWPSGKPQASARAGQSRNQSRTCS
jgi:hypothetical protein